jgi:hypothetical protein
MKLVPYKKGRTQAEGFQVPGVEDSEIFRESGKEDSRKLHKFRVFVRMLLTTYCSNDQINPLTPNEI